MSDSYKAISVYDLPSHEKEMSILQELEQCMRCLKRSRLYFQESKEDEARSAIDRVNIALQTLKLIGDPQQRPELVQNLGETYDYIERTLFQLRQEQDPLLMKQLIEIFQTLYEGWVSALGAHERSGSF